jgi:hypothetical protein
MTHVRLGAPEVALSRAEFRARFRARFVDPAFDRVSDELDAVEDVAWEAYSTHRKAPRTRRAGTEFADASYELSLDWLATREAIAAARAVMTRTARRGSWWSRAERGTSTHVPESSRRVNVWQTSR